MRTDALPSSALSALGLLGLGNLTMLADVFTGTGWLFLLGAALAITGDHLCARVPLLGPALEAAQLTPFARQAIREALLLALVLRAGQPALLWPAVIGITGVLTLRALLAATEKAALELLQPRLATRNLGPSEEVFEAGTPLAQAIPGYPLLAGGGLAVGLGRAWPLLVGALLSAAVLLAWIGVRWARVLTRRRANSYRTNLGRVRTAVDALEPEVVLYFSGPPEAGYQVSMWLPVLERLGRRALVVLREYPHLDSVTGTSLPVLCIPRATDMMDFRLPTVRVAFYVAHVGKNIHLQREPRMKHVFIGHGESDKVASVNPISKACDEIWVAGSISRQRWHAARVGIHDEAIVEVGRPQLDGVSGVRPPVEGRPFSVLYAPTWEGWTSDPFTSSLLRLGPALVEWLLQQPGVRVLYKPHPLTGHVSREAAAADARIRRAIAEHAAGGTLAVPVTADSWQQAEWSHLVITGPEPTLYECFNNADLLIGDISSVVPDFLASEKPYAIPNPKGLDHEAMRQEFASARGAYILDPEPAGWSALLADAMGADTMRPQRLALRLATLGPRYDDYLQPWREAVADLIRRADAEWPTAYADVLGEPLEDADPEDET